MKYRELLELYKKNELNEQQRQQVENDIEKQEAISDYLFEKEEADEFAVMGEGDCAEEKSRNEKKQADEFTRLVNRKIRNTFIKMGVIVSGITLAIILFVIFVLPNQISNIYYNPGEEVGAHTNQMSIDLRTYTEATMPLKIRSVVDVIDRGYGNYGISIPQNQSFTGKFQNITGEISRNELVLYNANILRKPSSNAFAWFQIREDISKPLSYWIDEVGVMNTCASGNREQAMEKLYTLKSDTMYEAYVTLNQILPYEEFMEFQESTQIGAQWCALLTASPASNGGFLDNLGMECSLSQSSVLNFDEEAYPELFVWRTELGPVSEIEDNTEQAKENIKKEEPMKQHFISLMNYLADQKEFLNMMGEKDLEKFERAAAYVEENGLMVYGYVTIGEKEDLIKLAEENKDAVYQIYAVEMQ